MFCIGVLLRLVATASAVSPLVLDDAGASHTGGVQCVGAGHAGAFLHNNGSMGNVDTFATYDFQVAKSGCYLIEEHHPASDTCGGHALKFVPLRVEYCRNGVAWGAVCQGANGGKWNKLGKLPFLSSVPGRISITRGGFPPHICPKDRCFWAADAFRLTWLAETCHQADPRMRAQAEAELDGNEVPEYADEEVRIALYVQAVLDQPRYQSTFTFNAPLDGCYVVEERHPHIPGASKEPLEIKFCRNLVANGFLDHTDGRHLQWNYVASLPFFDDNEGSIMLPHALLRKAEAEQGNHEFRLTHVGPKCGAEAAQVLQAIFRISADFSLVQNRLAIFRDELTDLLATAAGVEPSRLRISSLRAGSIVAEVTLLPAPTARIVDGDPPARTAPEAMVALNAALNTPVLELQLCTAAGAAAPACSVSVEGTGAAKPLVLRRKDSGKPEPDDKWSAGCVALVVCCSVAGVLLVAGSAYGLYRRRRANNMRPAQKQIEDPTQIEEPKKVEDPTPQEQIEDPKQVEEARKAEDPMQQAAEQARVCEL